MAERKSKYEQIWDSEWEPLPKEFYLACCSCGLVHRVRIRVRKGKPEMCFSTDNRKTAALRRERRKNKQDPLET